MEKESHMLSSLTTRVSISYDLLYKDGEGGLHRPIQTADWHQFAFDIASLVPSSIRKDFLICCSYRHG